MTHQKSRRGKSPIVFDVGRVLIEWDVNILFRKYFGTQAEISRFLDETDLMIWNLKFDEGFPLAQGLEQLATAHPHYRDALMAFDHDWMETVPGAIHGSVQILETLKQQNVPLYAVTNFSTEKWPLAAARFPFLATSFLDVVVSGKERVVKPDPAIFRILAERNQLELSNCIFIDDAIKNVEGASSLGMDAIHFQTAQKLQTDLKARGYDV